MQALLHYDDTKTVSSSVLTIPTDRLMSLACDPSGSHIVDAFLTSRNVTLKKKNKLIKKFMVCSVTVFCCLDVNFVRHLNSTLLSVVQLVFVHYCINLIFI